MLVVLLATVLLIVDHRTSFFSPLKSSLITLTRPIYWFADLQHFFSQWKDNNLQTREDLQVENTSLQAENLVLHARVQRLAALTIENVRLRELLNSTKLFEENVLVAEIIAVSSDPLSQYVMLNKGRTDGVYVGQAVIDAYGLFGQIMEVAETTSRVLLISDPRHAVPIQVDRNGVRMIVEGTGKYTSLRLPHIAFTTDVVVGDVLSTSGLGGVFPLGYPVARVTEVKHDPGQTFATVSAEPFARLDRTRHVLLLFEIGKNDETQ